MDFDQDVIEIVPNGDVALVIARHKRRAVGKAQGLAQSCQVIVSSSMLMAHSTMFRGMLANNFQEGQSLKRDGRVSIPLPDINVETVCYLSALIHNKLNLIGNIHDSFETLRAIVCLSERWDTHETICLNLAHVGFPAPESDISLPRALETMFLAYKVGAQNTFDLYCKHLLEERELKETFNSWPAWADDAQFCFTVENINSIRKEAHARVLDTMCELLERRKPYLWEEHCDITDCSGKFLFKASHPEGFLVSSGLLPPSQIGRRTFAEISEKMGFWENFGLQHLATECSICKSPAMTAFLCSAQKRAFAPFKDGVDIIKEMMEEVNTCIVCLKLSPWTACESCTYSTA